MPKQITKARSLRRENTKAEAALWKCLRNSQLGVKFRRQVPLGPYIADFACIELKLVVEVDGGQHCENAKDAVRTAYLKKLGYEVIRFWNNDVTDNVEGVVSTLTLTLSQRRGD